LPNNSTSFLKNKKVVNLSLSPPCKHIRGSRNIAPLNLNLSSKWCVTHITLWLFYPHEIAPVAIEKEAGCAQKQVLMGWRREKSLAPTGI